jgi:hypothetical protein
MRLNKYSISKITFLIVIGVTPACGSTTPSDTLPVQKSMQATRNNKDNRIPGEYLITLSAGESEQIISKNLSNFGITRIQSLGNNVFLVIIKDDLGAEGISAIIEKDARFKSVQPNLAYKSKKLI